MFITSTLKPPCEKRPKSKTAVMECVCVFFGNFYSPFVYSPPAASASFKDTKSGREKTLSTFPFLISFDRGGLTPLK